ncbi:hypothetical protein C8J40_11015 [Sphingomonas sp. PP-CC-3A-396]|nr:hypothetical protein C8J40_11015 [Sphingomonas sp. PP-CC-3A-396]
MLLRMETPDWDAAGVPDQYGTPIALAWERDPNQTVTIRCTD